jgi:uncharacterized coiled-coil protein SlyX
MKRENDNRVTELEKIKSKNELDIAALTKELAASQSKLNEVQGKLDSIEGHTKGVLDLKEADLEGFRR